LDPALTGIDIDGKIASSKKSGIHPHTAYDITPSEVVTPNDSDEEERRDSIRLAQELSMKVSVIKSDAQKARCIRQVLRGDYQDLAEEAKQGLRRQRMYLVATDLSEEAAYALEWTIGTVLKDGDTLFAIYCADVADVTDGSDGRLAKTTHEEAAVGIGEAGPLLDATAEVVRVLSHSDQPSPPPGGVVSSTLRIPLASMRPRSSSDTLARSRSLLTEGGRGPGTPLSQSVDVSGMGKAERERIRANEAISERCMGLLRKTKLQVRVIVDVVHCKSPRHTLIETVGFTLGTHGVAENYSNASQIDYLQPTLVVLGSRGRSALKGVLLGSFSNYLVTKSSVPVMVARKKLRKHNKNFNPSNIRLSNVLSTSSNQKLASAKIDKVISKSSS
jgi:nucleotide-binding universal stress UspA family protein